MKADVLALLAPGEAVSLKSEGDVFGAGLAVEAAGVVSIAMWPPTIEVTPAGVAFPFDWGPLPAGTDRVELSPVTVEVMADDVAQFAGYSLGELGTAKSGNDLVVTVPAGRRIRALHFASLASDGTSLGSEPDLRAAGRRITVRLPDPKGGWAAPVIAVPPVGAQGQIPATLTGASFANGVLKLPDLPGNLRVAVVEGDTPDKFTTHDVSVGAVTGWAAPTPVDLTLKGSDGKVLWNYPDALPRDARQRADVTVAVTAAVEALRAAGSPIKGALTVFSKFPCQVGFRVADIQGDLVRTIKGTTTVTLAGEPAVLPLADPLPADVPSRVVADVTVRYAGRRLAEVSDPLPAAGAQHGVVVRAEPALRALPPQALRGAQVTGVGLVGYCPEEAALLVRVVRADTPQTPGGSPTALGKPATVRVAAGTDVRVIWVDFPEPVPIDRPVAVEVSAGKGRLNWVSGDNPLLRVVIADPDPGGRPVTIGDSTLVTVSTAELSTARAVVPANVFADTAPALASALFCAVELTDAELRYSRGG